MKLGIAVFLVVLALFGVTFYWLSSAPEKQGLESQRPTAIDASSTSSGTKSTAIASRPESVAGTSSAREIAPTTQPSRGNVRLAVAQAPSAAERARAITLARISEFEAGRGWRELVERALNQPGSLDLEERYLAARAMDICEAQRGQTRDRSAERENFIKNLPTNETQRADRLKSYQQLNLDPCAQLQGLNLSRELIQRMLQEASLEGDAKSRVLLLEKEIRTNPQPVRTSGLSHEQRSTLRDALTSQDPAVIRRTGEILFSAQSNWQNTFGPEKERVEPWLVSAAWRLVACDYGMPCGPDSTVVLSACAYSSRCNAQSQEQLMQMYDLGAQRFQDVQRYRAIIAQAITEGRWSWIGLGG
jgi:hypothetical protein